jgi:hypothetical protein
LIPCLISHSRLPPLVEFRDVARLSGASFLVKGFGLGLVLPVRHNIQSN